MRRLVGLLVITCCMLSCSHRENQNHYSAIVEGTLVQVPALVGGKLVDLRVSTGSQVQAGDTLAVMDTTELILQRKQLQASLQQVSIQQEIARTALERARSDFDYVQENYNRTQTLVRSQSVPQQNLDDLKNKLQNVESAVQTASNRVLSAAAQKQVVEAQLESVANKLQDAVITAPMSGIVSETYFEQAEAVPPMKSVVELLKLDVVETRIYVSETMLPHIQIGQSISVHIDGSKDILQGRVIWTSPKAEFTPKQVLTPETRTSLVYAVNVQIDNQNHILKHGMPIEVIL